ncbi:hypothetical protein KA107_01170 [Candidatus Pacearchaeota archaeon]|nr:hypothetical protein [Candidatus Pacearchaeota archaeon]
MKRPKYSLARETVSVRWINSYVPGGERYSVGVDSEGHEVTSRYPPIIKNRLQEEQEATRALNESYIRD